MRSSRKLLTGVAVLALFGAGTAAAQQVISMKAGVVHLSEGDVFLNDQPFQRKPTEFPEIKIGGVLRTEEGRAEVLLTPGSILRMGENTSFKLLANKLEDVRFEVTRGVALVEVTEFDKLHHMVATVGEVSVELRKAGLYRLDADKKNIRVYEGEALVANGEQRWTLKGGRGLTAANGAWTTEKFDTDQVDALYRWSKRRASYLAMANISTARSASRSGWLSRTSGWIFNPYFGYMTYVPWGRTFYSPFGYAFYSPDTVYYVYAPRPVFSNGGGGFGGGGRSAPGGFGASYDSSVGYSVGARSAGGAYTGGGAVSSGAPAASAGASSGGGRSGGDAGGRGASSGGGRGQ